ncbi:MAG TPA: 16S rRNA (adenine(1518)-N(6)/adenine(1519)-N(6))-dimethyltransferase RsmA [Candidatus Marinimicrobia bacterium]|nr:16S rRNA (adenine(1518)-N(6)/adenine(1519)-N(6))-dimethyltransferase RsmA [Candidatus Neomarinimicrobiota bacterium]
MTNNTHHTFRKKWGQNFLADTNLLRKIVRTINPTADDTILEIGPGEGALTEHVLPLVKYMAAIEIDPKLIKYLNGRDDLQDCHFIHKDVLWQKLDNLPIPTPIKIIGNIPYNITSPILFWLIEQRAHWTAAFIMVQKEMADRLTGEVGTKSYGRLTVMIGAFLNVKTCFTIPPDVFIPKPKVKSAIIKLVKRHDPLIEDKYFERFEKIVAAAFSRRRKMLRNTLSDFGLPEEIQKKIDFTRRPETLSISEFSELAKTI